ncbi:MAG: hypothetical protein AAF267_25680, partial [Deinococcota bacterium]
VKFFRPDGRVWYCSKGHERFNVPNYALLGEKGQAKQALDLFTHLFNYVREYNAVLDVGHTAQLGDMALAFDAVTEYQEFLDSPKTLVVSMLSS